MRDFFHGWRRKVALAFFGTACAFATLWIYGACFGGEIFRRDTRTAWLPQYDVVSFTPLGIRREIYTRVDEYIVEHGYWLSSDTTIPYWQLVAWPAVFGAVFILWNPRTRKSSTNG